MLFESVFVLDRGSTLAGSRQNEGSDEKEKAKKNGHFLPPSLSRKPKLGP
jgi:hypothetical protein